MRLKRGCVNGLTQYLVAMFIFIPTFVAAVSVHEHARQWEAPAVFIALGLGLIPAIWYFRTKRYGWLAGILSGLLLCFSFAVALFHGWKTQALSLITIAGVIVTVAIGVVLFRMRRRTESALRALGEDLNGNPHPRGDILFRDDGERITIYPNRRSLLVQGVFQAAMLAVIGAIAWFARVGNPILAILLGVCFALLALAFLALLSRLLIRRPTLTVGPDGIFDHGSLFGTGTGMLRWDEILSVTPLARQSGMVTHRYLAILVTDIRAIRQRQPLWKRGVLRFTALAPSTLAIWQGMLDVPVVGLTIQIRRYVESHAPAGWFKDVV